MISEPLPPLDQVIKTADSILGQVAKAIEGPSPFLEGTHIQFAWDSTSLGWLKTCPRLYYYKMIEGWRSRGESVALKWGQEYHHALELYYKLLAGMDHGTVYDHESAVFEVVRDVLIRTWPWSWDDHNWSRENLVRSVVWYLDEFKDDACKTVILENGKPAVELSFQMPLDWGPGDYYIPDEETRAAIIAEGGTPNQPYVLCGHLDRVVSLDDNAFGMDHKSTKSTVSSNFFERFDPDNQMSLYTFATRVIFKTPVRGIIIDAAQIAVGFTKFTRGFTYRTEGQLEEWMNDLRFWLAQAESFAVSGHWPMNDKACFLCGFKGICSKDPSVRQRFLEADFVRDPWNPLKVR